MYSVARQMPTQERLACSAMAYKVIGATIWHLYVSLTLTAAPTSNNTSGPQDCDCSVSTAVTVTLVIINSIAIVTFLWKRRQACQKLHRERPPDVVVTTEDSTSECATVTDVPAATGGETDAVIGASGTFEVILVNKTYVSADRCLRNGMPSDTSRNKLTQGEDRIPEKDTLDKDTPELEKPEQDALDQDILEQDTLDEDILEQETVYQDVSDMDTSEQDVLDEDTLEQDISDMESLYEDIPEIDTTVQLI